MLTEEGYALTLAGRKLERLEAAVANDDPGEARRLLERMPFSDDQRRHVAGLIDRWEAERDAG